MRFVFAYAGIPSEAYDHIYKRRSTLIGGNAEFEGMPLGPRGSTYQERHANALLLRFKDRILRDRANANSDTGFAVIYVRADVESTARFERAFFPTTLLFPVNWQLAGGSPQDVSESNNELFRLLFLATIKARAILNALYKELAERMHRTPVLLPLRNFQSNTLVGWLKRLQSDLATEEDPEYVIREAVKVIENAYPMKMAADPKRKRRCFFDDDEVEFHSPGRALHGLACPWNNHPLYCLLGGRRRLGAPYNAAFHYDCAKGDRPLKGRFYDCHSEERVTVEGHNHINVAPNDFFRVTK